MSTPNHRPAQEALSQAATLGGARAAPGRNSPGEEDATGESRNNQLGSYPAGFVLAEAPAHASKDELLELVADRDGWRREVLRIDPSLVSTCPTVAVWAKNKFPPQSIWRVGIGLRGACKFSGGHVKWAQETTKALL